jgi:hypothetical protein
MICQGQSCPEGQQQKSPDLRGFQGIFQINRDFSVCILAERVGFEPTVPCGTPDFESGTFGHSATSPVWSRYSTSPTVAHFV